MRTTVCAMIEWHGLFFQFHDTFSWSVLQSVDIELPMPELPLWPPLPPPAHVQISSQGLATLCLRTEHAHQRMRNDWIGWLFFNVFALFRPLDSLCSALQIVAIECLLPLPPLLPPPSHVRISSQGLRRSLSAHRACAASYAQWPRVCKAFCHAPTAPARTQRSLFPLSQFEGGSKVKFTGIVQCTYEIYKYFGHSNFFFQQKFQYWSQYWNLQKCLLILSVCFKCMSCPGFWSAEHNSRKRVAWFVIHRCVLNKILGTRYTQPFRQNFDLQST